MEVFKEELKAIKNNYRDLQKDQINLLRVLEKLKSICVSSECRLGRARLSARTGDLDNIYKSLGCAMPDKVKVAMYLVH